MFHLLIIFSVIGYLNANSQETVQLPPEVASKALQAGMQCVGETGVDPTIAINLRNKKIGSDPQTQKFLFCMLRKTGIVNKKGHIKVEKSLELYPKNVDKDAIKKAMEECNKEEGKDPTETAHKVIKCYQVKTPVKISLA